MIRRLVLTLAALGAALMAAAAAQAGDIRPLGQGDWAALRAAHAGRPVIVHFWSLTCAPCLAELPAWRQVHGADLVLVATDPVEQAPRLKAALAKAGLAGAESWAFADPYTEKLRFEIDRRWRGELPRTLLIGADGNVETVSGTIEPERLRQWLENAHAALH